MISLAEKLAERDPDDVVIEAGEKSLTAHDVLLGCENIHQRLRRDGIDRLGLLAENSPAWILTDLAAQLGGICLLPLPMFFSTAQLLHSITSAGLDAIVTDDPERVRHILAGSTLGGDPDEEFGQGLTLIRLRGYKKSLLPPATQKITFTSGSTGAPRGVCLGIEQQLRVAGALHKALQLHHPRHLCLLPLSTLLENVCGVYYPIIANGIISVPPAAETGFAGTSELNILNLLRVLRRHRPASIILLPQMLAGLVAALEEGWRVPAELKFAAVGGAKVADALISRARAYGLPVYEGYGLSETASVACLNVPGRDRIGSVGQPLSHVDLHIDAGEILISGNSFLGYVDEPESWERQTVATGDLGAQDPDGFVMLQGRRRNILISSLGRNISPEWIESEVLSNPQIEQCLVFGDDRPYCTALIATADPETRNRDVQSWIDTVNAKLPDYARIRRWSRLPETLATADGLFTENGRPRRERIAHRYAGAIESLYIEMSGQVPAKVSTA